MKVLEQVPGLHMSVERTSTQPLEKERIRTTEPEISNLDVSEDTEHSLLCFSGKLAGKDAVFLVDSGSTHDFVSQKTITLKLSVWARNFQSPLPTAVRLHRSSR